MNRAQLLLTKNQAEEIKKLAKKQGVSQSELVRKLLDQSLGVAKQQPTVSSGDWVCSLNEFGEENPRVQGFKEIYSVGGKHPEIRIITDATFRYYLANGTLPPGLDYRLLELGNQLKEFSRTQKLVLRRAYLVPGMQNPPGPRFLGVEPADIAAALVELYKFAIEHKYYEPEGARIVAFIYPFADPEPLQLPISASMDLPYGGYAIPVNKDASRVEVLATWGNNEGVQSFEAIDRCTVDAEKQIIIEKNIPQKNVMLATTMDEQSAKIELPLHKQFEQILSDMEILETARIVRELTQKYGLRRIEFSYDGRSGLEYNESIPYQLNEAPVHQFEQTARIKIIYTEKDVQAVKKLKKSEVTKTILLIDRAIVENRSYDVLNSVASLPHKFTVFYPGLAATAHAMRVLTDFGHTAIVVGSRKYEDGEQVLVKVDADQQINIQRLSIADRSSAVVGLYDARLYGIEKVGGKAFNLSILKTKGFNVPHGFVLTTEVFDQVIAENFTQKMRKSLLDTGVKNIAEVEELGRNLVKFPR
ncbi:ribbon-helix-helix protein, CopG family, partial [Candidatus Dojkabacteria bacterium]|nr:ribbon-helix-helix protein, CopG family [Candidatus Dojkabacteria bacterium]